MGRVQELNDGFRHRSRSAESNRTRGLVSETCTNREPGAVATGCYGQRTLRFQILKFQISSKFVDYLCAAVTLELSVDWFQGGG